MPRDSQSLGRNAVPVRVRDVWQGTEAYLKDERYSW